MAAAEDDEKEKLDFTSEHFDAVLALTSDNVQPPDPSARPLDNLAQYSSLTAKQQTSKASRQPAAMTIEQSMAALSAQRKERLEAMMLKARIADSDEDEEETKAGGMRHRGKTKNVLSFMETVYCSQGPLGILYRCLRDRTRVKVWTRNYGHVRGICTGYVAAFDKHWNLAMTDVDEVYVMRPGAKTVARGKKVVKVTDARVIVEEDEDNEEEESITPAGERSSAGEEESEEALQQRLALLKEQLQQISADEDEDDADLESAETPTVPTKDDNIQQPLLQQERTKENRKNPRRRKQAKPIVKNRHVNQLFIRGENVVIIALLEC